MAVNIPIWPGSASLSDVAGNTPFGLYDTDDAYVTASIQTADWCAKRLGYPIVDIELQDKQFFACFEEAVTEYGAQVNRFNIRENLLTVKGGATGSSYTGKNIEGGLDGVIQIAKTYGSEAGSGGNIDWYSGSIAITSGSQVYDLASTANSCSYESGTPGTDAIEIKKIFHEGTPAIQRLFDPYVGTGAGASQLMQSFGWGGYSPSINYLVMPLYDDMLRMQQIEFNDHVRKSAFTFELINNKLRVFPKPISNYTFYFQYIKISDRRGRSTEGVISDFSNVAYDNIPYTHINDPGRSWIRKYTLALTKELLGTVRGKYSTVPIPGADTSLDGDALRSEGAAEKEGLIAQLREDLEAASRRNSMERSKEESEFQQELINKVPLGIYLG
tara:strand:- start:169 stop:1329 length:1161 start_codon:yes stop_codon:yes gene_type:complete